VNRTWGVEGRTQGTDEHKPQRLDDIHDYDFRDRLLEEGARPFSSETVIDSAIKI
jgi:hypothetical protein